jgi:hypothetical protein
MSVWGFLKTVLNVDQEKQVQGRPYRIVETDKPYIMVGTSRTTEIITKLPGLLCCRPSGVPGSRTARTESQGLQVMAD